MVMREDGPNSYTGRAGIWAHETGFTKIYGDGRPGLIAFRSLGEIARQFFEAEKVLRSLLERAGISL
jgi:hypothetical protein